MGKALIISDDGDGLYTVEIKHDTTAADTQLTRLDAILSAVNQKITDEKAKDEPDQSVIAALNLRKTALQKRIDTVTEARDADYQTSVWCADRTAGLSGNVGTIEPGTQRGNGINIQPGAGGEAVWDGARDGQATPFLTMDVADAMRNLAILPAIQKWRPTYRYGTISNIDYTADTCTVTLDNLASNIQNLNINHQSVLNAVPIEYMSCNAAAFEDGDRVIVGFSPYSTEGQPRVIGFVDHPKACDIFIKLNTINGCDIPMTGLTNYRVRLTQPIETTVSHPSKGTYTEDFTAVASADHIDGNNVARLIPEDGVRIDHNHPVHVSIWNAHKWTYWTTDWRGDVPDRGFYWTEDRHPAWETYPGGDLSGYDYLLDVVQWVNTGIDIRNLGTSSFQDGDGNTVTGYSIDVAGIYALRRDHYYYEFSDMVCSYGDTDYFPTDVDQHDYRYVSNVPHDFDNDDFDHIPISLHLSIPCHQTNSTAQCESGGTGETYRAYGLSDEDRQGGYTFGDPGILCDRSGRNINGYQTSKLEYSALGTYRCSWTFMEDVPDGEGGWCFAGEFAAQCPDGALEIAEGMIYEMVELTDV